MKSKYFTTGYLYLYSLAIVAIDTLTLSRNSQHLFNYEVFSGRVLAVFSYWLFVKKFAGLAERKGFSYKLAMLIALIGLPGLAALAV
jgi:cytosine/uracil/thiamine/allantoin permease